MKRDLAGSCEKTSDAVLDKTPVSISSPGARHSPLRLQLGRCAKAASLTAENRFDLYPLSTRDQLIQETHALN